MENDKKSLHYEELQGDKIILEPFSLKRATEFYKLYQASKRTWDAFINLPLDSPEQAVSYIIEQEVMNIPAYFIIEKTSNKLAGYILGDKLFEETQLISRTRAIGTAFEKKGYAREAALLFDAWAKKAGYIGMVVLIVPYNIRALRLAEREGFEKHDIPAQTPSGIPLLVYAKAL